MEMSNTFLLRYQEFCLKEETADVCCGTKTHTRVGGERPGNEANAAPPAGLARESCSGGTMTKTSIARESGGQDQDWSESQMRVFAGRPKSTESTLAILHPARPAFLPFPDHRQPW